MAHDLKLPATIVGPSDLGRAKRDLDLYNEQQHQADLRMKASGKAETVHAGRVVSELAALNGCDLTVANERTSLLQDVEAALKAAPTITLSFAVDPSASFLAKIVDWLRTQIHPQVLVRVGLQPNITAGCIVRSGSKIYDFSLRKKLAEQRPLLIKSLQLGSAQKGVTIAAPSVEAV